MSDINFPAFMSNDDTVSYLLDFLDMHDDMQNIELVSKRLYKIANGYAAYSQYKELLSLIRANSIYRLLSPIYNNKISLLIIFSIKKSFAASYEKMIKKHKLDAIVNAYKLALISNDIEAAQVLEKELHKTDAENFLFYKYNIERLIHILDDIAGNLLCPTPMESESYNGSARLYAYVHAIFQL